MGLPRGYIEQQQRKAQRHRSLEAAARRRGDTRKAAAHRERAEMHERRAVQG